MKCGRLLVLVLVLSLCLDQTEAKDKESKQEKKKPDDGRPKAKRHKPLKLKMIPSTHVLIGPETSPSHPIGPQTQGSAVTGPHTEGSFLEMFKMELDSPIDTEPALSEPGRPNDAVEKWEQQQKRKDETRRRKKRKRQEKQRKKEDQALRIQVYNEQKKWRQEEAEQGKQEEAEFRKAEEEVWLRGDNFENINEEEETIEPAPIPTPPRARDVLEESDPGPDPSGLDRAGLPQGCDISDVTVSCENANLQHFPALSIPELKSLSLEGNNISTIPAEAFNGILNLEWINLKKNRLTSAGIHPQAFQRLKILTRLYMDQNLLETVPSGLPSSLQELKINENRLRDVQETSLRGLHSLVTLELEGNGLSERSMAHGAFKDLLELSYLRLGRNHFRAVPQGLPPTLQELYLEHNRIEEISESVLNQTQSLTVISLRNNRLDETRIAPRAWIHHRSLESLDLSHNDLHLVPSFLPQSLIHLVLMGNSIERIPGYVFAHMFPGLEYLYLSYNKLDGEGFEPESFLGTYSSMVELCLDHNQLQNVPSGINEMSNLHFLRLDDNNIRTVPVDSLCDRGLEEGTLVTLRLDNNFIDPRTVDPSAFSCLRATSGLVLKPQHGTGNAAAERTPERP